MINSNVGTNGLTNTEAVSDTRKVVNKVIDRSNYYKIDVLSERAQPIINRFY